MSKAALSPGGAVAARLAVVVAVTLAGLAAFQTPFRDLEAAAALGILNASGVDSVFKAGHAAIGVAPGSGPAFRAIVTVPCSSLASLLALCALAAPLRLGRRFAALAAALVTVAAGNILRIAASVGVGVWAGRSSLILFHDWVGSMFSFAYTLGGYILLLYLLLRGAPARLRPKTASGPAPSLGMG